jgi:hypothetical protein
MQISAKSRLKWPKMTYRRLIDGKSRFVSGENLYVATGGNNEL